MRVEITPMILTFNEAPNIRNALNKLPWAREVLVIDSFSTDETLEIVRQFPAARVVQRKFDTFAQQCNFGLEQVSTEWVLSLDADYIVSDQLVKELERLAPSSHIAGYSAAFKYCVFGHSLRASLYPPRTILYRRSSARYRNDGHGHRVEIQGRVEPLKSFIYHDDRKPLSRWLDSQRNYARLEAEHLRKQDPKTLRWPDRLRCWIWPAAPTAFLYTLLLKGCLLDGWPGWFYVLQRTYAELLLSLELLDGRLRNVEPSESTKELDARSVPSDPEIKICNDFHSGN